MAEIKGRPDQPNPWSLRRDNRCLERFLARGPSKCYEKVNHLMQLTIVRPWKALNLKGMPCQDGCNLEPIKCRPTNHHARSITNNERYNWLGLGSCKSNCNVGWGGAFAALGARRCRRRRGSLLCMTTMHEALQKCAVLNGADFQECCASLGTRDETNLKEVHSVFMADRTLGLKADNLTPL